MKPKFMAMLATLLVLLIAATIGTAQISAQQVPTPTPGASVPTPTPHPDLAGRIKDLEDKQDLIIDSLKSSNTFNQVVIGAVGGVIAILVGVQSFAAFSQARHEREQDERQALREEGRDLIDRTGALQMLRIMKVLEETLESRLTAEKQDRETERDGVQKVAKVMDVVQKTLENRLDLETMSTGQVSQIMDVVQKTLETHLETEKRAQKQVEDAQERLETSLKQFAPLQHFFQSFQNTIKSSRETIEKRASDLAQTSRHDFRGMASALNDFAQQFDRFKAESEALEEEPHPRFSARVSYIRGIAAHYANQLKDAKQYLEEVGRFREREPDELELAYTRRVANAYYYLGLTESNFGNHQDAIAFFKKANELDLQDRDFLTRVVTAESYVMMNEFDHARLFLNYVEERLSEIERQEGRLRNFHLRLRSRAALVKANMAVLERKANWREEAQQLLEPVHTADPQYYYATVTLAQVYHEQGDHNKAQEFFSEAYGTIEHSGHLLTVTEIRSRILLLTTAGLCCKHGPADESRAQELLDEAHGLLGSLPKMDDRVCTVFSTLSKRNETSGTIGNHIEWIRKGQVLLGPGD